LAAAGGRASSSIYAGTSAISSTYLMRADPEDY
jgi:hypothetical protein